MDEILLNKYREVCLLTKGIEEQKKELGNQVIEHLKAMGIDNYSSDKIGTFSIGVRRNWEYSEKLQTKIKKLKETIKEAQNKEEETGKAKSIDTEFITYRSKK